MAKIVLDRREYNLYRKDKKIRKSIINAAMQIAGDLDGYGIDLVDENGNDLSCGECQYCPPVVEPKVIIKDERTLPTEILKR